MHRFYLPPEQCRGKSLCLDGREAHHALHVLRLQRDAQVIVLDGDGHEFLCSVESKTKQILTLSILDKKHTPTPQCPITLLVAIPKGKLIESIIQKAVELGAQRIVPLQTARVIVQLDEDGAEAKCQKWQEVAIEAIKQCGATWLPRVEVPQTIAKFLAGNHPMELALVGSLQTVRKHPRAWFQEFQQQNGRGPRSAGAWIGPEGDFTLGELQSIEASGAKPITLGNLTLRVETAAIYCLSFLNYELSWLNHGP